LTTTDWSASDCASHQATAEGVNAYLKAPFTEAKVVEIIEGVLGQPMPKKASAERNETPVSISSLPVLEDVSSVFLRRDVTSEQPSEASGPNIVLDAPELGSELSVGEGASPSEAVPVEMVSSSFAMEDSGPPSAMEDSPPDAILDSPLSVMPDSPPDIMLESPPEASLESVETVAPSLVAEVPFPSQSEEKPMEDSAALSDSAVEDNEVAQEMPYLFGALRQKLFGSKKTHQPLQQPRMMFSESLGDAVIPGGIAHSPDLETMKKYLFLREQDVAVLSGQLKAAQDQIALMEKTIRDERAKNVEFSHVVNEQKQKIDNFETDQSGLSDSFQSEIAELRFQARAKSDKARVLENQVREITEEMEQLKIRVRMDIRKIRVREKELENRVEVMKKDSEALMSARENKIIELKRKLDLLEFNMDLLQDQYAREKEHSTKLREQLARVAQVVRVAGGLLDTSKGQGNSDSDSQSGVGDGERKVS